MTDMAQAQVEAQFGLEKWMNGDGAASAEHLSTAVRVLAEAGRLTREDCDAKLTAYLSLPTVNVFACMNSVISSAVENWVQTQGEAVKTDLPA